DAPGGAVQKLDAQVVFEPLDQFGHRGLGHAQRVRGVGERTGLHDSHEHPHGLHLVEIRTQYLGIQGAPHANHTETRRKPMNKKLSGKAALVTGGSRGIGAAIARSLADEGADVAISYVSNAEKAKVLVRELQEKGVRAAAFQADQASSEAVATLVRKVAEHFGHLDI